MNEFETEIVNCIEVLRKGGIILYPTDTIWGIGCDATNEKAVARIFELKKRAINKSMVILLDTEEKLPRYVNHVPAAATEIMHKATRPTTIIYNGGNNVTNKLLAIDGSIAIRIVKDAFCSELINRLNKPLVSTSANISNEPSPASFKEIDIQVLEGVDYVVNLRRDEINASPSSIIRIDENGQIQVLRN